MLAKKLSNYRCNGILNNVGHSPANHGICSRIPFFSKCFFSKMLRRPVIEKISEWFPGYSCSSLFIKHERQSASVTSSTSLMMPASGENDHSRRCQEGGEVSGQHQHVRCTNIAFFAFVKHSFRIPNIFTSSLKNSFYPMNRRRSLSLLVRAFNSLELTMSDERN